MQAVYIRCACKFLHTGTALETGEECPVLGECAYHKAQRERIAELERQLAEARAENELLREALNDIADYDCEEWSVAGRVCCGNCPSCEARQAIAGEGQEG